MSSVIGIVFDQGQVLVLQRKDVPVWVLPGGGIDQGELPEEAVLREIFEETGFQVRIVRKVALYTPINRLTLPTYLFECAICGGEMTLGDETRSIGFYPTESLPEPFFFLHREWLQDALEEKNLSDLPLPQVGRHQEFRKRSNNFPIEKPISQVTYTRLLLYFLRHPWQVMRLLLSRLGLPWNS